MAEDDKLNGKFSLTNHWATFACINSMPEKNLQLYCAQKFLLVLDILNEFPNIFCEFFKLFATDVISFLLLCTGDWSNFVFVGEILVGGYLLHYIPFFLTDRTLFLHSYLPCVIYKILVMAALTDHLYSLSKRWLTMFTIFKWQYMFDSTPHRG